MDNYIYVVEDNRLIKEEAYYNGKKQTLVDESQKAFHPVFEELLTKINNLQEKIEFMSNDITALKNDLDERERVNRRRYRDDY